ETEKLMEARCDGRVLTPNRRPIEHIALNQLNTIVFGQHAGGDHQRICSRRVSPPVGSCTWVLNDTSTITPSPVLRNACTTPGGMVSRQISPAGTSRSRISPSSLRRIRQGPATEVISTALR